MIASIRELLAREKVPYTLFRHRPAYTALEVTAVSHVPGRCWAKVVICLADSEVVQAVLPAHYTVDLDQLRALAGAQSVRLAREDEVATLYPECEVGAMPPFGVIYGHRVFVDRTFVGEPEMVFHAGTHSAALRMHFGDFAEIARPIVGLFGRAPARPSGPPISRRIRSSRLES